MGFSDIAQGQCHIIAHKFMTLLAANVHENVPEYDEATVNTHTHTNTHKHKIHVKTFRLFSPTCSGKVVRAEDVQSKAWCFVIPWFEQLVSFSVFWQADASNVWVSMPQKQILQDYLGPQAAGLEFSFLAFLGFGIIQEVNS